MPFIFKRLALFMSIAAVFATDKEFKAPPASSFAHKQSNEQVTIGAEAYVNGEKVRLAFGKVVPYDYGVLPVLVAIQNDSGKTLKLNRVKVEYVGPHGDRVVATPAREVRFAIPPKRPGLRGPLPLPAKKNPLNEWEIEGRAFAAEMLPAGQPAYGFFYFQTDLERGATIYFTGITEAVSGRDLFYFEIPLEQ
jgi:hypothetical protein